MYVHQYIFNEKTRKRTNKMKTEEIETKPVIIYTLHFCKCTYTQLWNHKFKSFLFPYTHFESFLTTCFVLVKCIEKSRLKFQWIDTQRAKAKKKKKNITKWKCPNFFNWISCLTVGHSCSFEIEMWNNKLPIRVEDMKMQQCAAIWSKSN